MNFHYQKKKEEDKKKDKEMLCSLNPLDPVQSGPSCHTPDSQFLWDLFNCCHDVFLYRPPNSKYARYLHALPTPLSHSSNITKGLPLSLYHT